MGKRGPKPSDPEALKRRGSSYNATPWAGGNQPHGNAKLAAPPKRRIAVTASKLSKKRIDLILRMVPGYDPFESADGCHVDYAAVRRAIGFIESRCRHVEGKFAGKLVKLEDWQRAIVGNVFGWKRADGTRRYREAFVYVPRKNGKTTLCAGLMLITLCDDDEPGAQVYSAAAEREQAALIFRVASGMALQDEELSARLKVYQTYKSIECRGSLGVTGTYKALSADAKSKHGFNSHAVYVDELHAQPNRELVDVLLTSTGSREQPIIVYITTADFERPSICNEKHDFASKVRDGIIDDASFFPCIYEALPDDDWEDPATWEKANPNLGVSVGREYLAREAKRAREQPTYVNTFKRLHLNVRTLSDIAWVHVEDFDACEPVGALAGPCYAGLDLAKTTDLTAVALYWPKTNCAIAHFFIPHDTALRAEQRDRVPYTTWARQGFVTLTPGNVTDYRFVQERIRELWKTYDVVDIGFDPYNASHMAQELQEDGLKLFEYPQGHTHMNEPTRALERLIVSRELRHDRNPVLRWNISNVMVETNATGLIRPSKKKSTGRIDGVIALVMALGRALHAERVPACPYETREPLIV